MLSRLRPITTVARSTASTTTNSRILSPLAPRQCGCAKCAPQGLPGGFGSINTSKLASSALFCSSIGTSSKRFFSSEGSNDDLVLLEKHPEKKTALLTLNRPKALNALNDDVISTLLKKLRELDQDDEVRCVVLTGSAKAFAAGADIKEMNTLSFSEVQKRDMLGFWNEIKSVKKPLIAAVSGYALGGGCELAMSCDFILASASAEFGQPEILLGTIPGCGGTQRLTHAVGKSKAMRWILNGERFGAEEAERAGLVAKVYDNDGFLEKCMEEASKIAKFSSPVLNVAKECVNQSQNLGLDDGLLFERRNFHATWGLDDRKEGMTAFAEKRKASFQDC